MRKGVMLILLAQLLLILLLGSGCRQEAAVMNTDDPALLLDSLEHKLAWISYRTAEETWNGHTGGGADSLDEFERMRTELTGNNRVYAALRNADSRLTDELARRRLELILPELVRTTVDRNEIIAPLYDSLADFYRTEWRRIEGRLISRAEAEQQMTYGRRLADRESAYRALSAPGEDIAGQLGKLIRLRNQIARRLGYNDYLSLYARSNRFDVNEYHQTLEKIDSLTRAPFETLLRELRSGFDGGVFEIWDWYNRFANTLTEGDRHFPVGIQTGLLGTTLERLGFDLDQLPIYTRLSEESGSTVELTLHRLQIPHDIRITGRLTDGYQSFQALLRLTSQAVHAASVDQDGFLLARDWDPAWDEATASLFENLCLSDVWLQSYAGMSPALSARFRTAQRAIRLLEIRLCLVQAMFEYRAYRNATGDLNDLYWDIFDDYIGLPEHRDLTPWAARPELASEPLAFYRKLQGGMAATQTWHYLTAHYGKIVDNLEVGSFIKHNYFRFGARYDWRELVERATGETLTPIYLAQTS